MTWRTHWVIGLNSLWLLTPELPYVPQNEMGVLLVAASLGSLLPDLNASESKIKHLQIGGIKPFFLPAQVVHRTDSHHGMLHSVVGLGFIAVTAVPTAFYLGGLPCLALVFGYANHLFADAATKAGIKPWYPCQGCFHLLPRECRISTGSQVEEALFAICVLCAMALLMNQLVV